MWRNLNFVQTNKPLKEIITSTQNPKIKNIVLLIEKSSERRKQQLIVVEGAREIGLSLQTGLVAEALYCCTEIFSKESLAVRDTLEDNGCSLFEVSKNVFDKIAFRENSDGLVLLAKPKFLSLDNLKLSATPLIIVLESVEKPGNLGAVLRTADAATVDAVIVCDPKCDIYNPNAIRSSVGCVFTNQIVAASSEEVLLWLKSNNITPFAAALTATEYYHKTNLNIATALVFGTEADGLTDFWLQKAHQIKIPMAGKIDSLNLSNSVAIMVFEALRQRGG